MSSLIRATLRPCSLLLRAPKKKGGGGKGGPAPAADSTSDPANSQLFNIFAGESDPALMPDDKYPTWLWQLEEKSPSYGELSMMFVHGINIENAEYYHFKRFLRLHRKLVIKTNNMRLKKNSRKAERAYAL